MYVLNFFIFACNLLLIFGAPKEDEIYNLPGLNDIINFKHYSGYLNGSAGDHLHYWFVESQQNPSKDPVVLWLNGGPGCSSLDGLLNELGPYLIEDDGETLHLNKHSWNKIGNVLFLEAPVCVGFSYKDGEGCKTDDDKTSLSNYKAIQSFYQKFPEYRENPLYITGESYAGVYVPTLTERLLKGKEDFPVNIEGFAVGNGLSSMELNDNSILFFAYYHGLLGHELWSYLKQYCCKNGIGTPEYCDFSTTLWPKCRFHVSNAMHIIYNSGLNMYNLYAKCEHPKNYKEAYESNRYVHDKNLPFYSLRSLQDGDKILYKLRLDPPCVDSSAMRTYLNNPKVQKIIHVKETQWDICNDEVNAQYGRLYKTMRDQYNYLIPKVKGLIYNGDVDMACNFLGDEWFADSLGIQQTEGRQMWHYDGQVAGFVKRFRRLDVVTVKGAGHMVPQDKPAQALHMISAFIQATRY